jgi:hypothetical protein
MELIATRSLGQGIPSGLVFGAEYLKQTRAILVTISFPYGIKQNRRMMENLIDYSCEQGLITDQAQSRRPLYTEHGRVVKEAVDSKKRPA